MTTFWRTYFAPLDESDLEHCPALEQDHNGDYFTIKVLVKHQLCITNSQIFPSVIPYDWYMDETENSEFLPSHVLIEHGIKFSDPTIPPEMIPTMTSDVITRANNIRVQNCLPNSYYESPNFRLFNLVLDITVQRLYDSERDYDEIADLISRHHSMGEVQNQLVPASKIAIESLKKVKVEEGTVIMESCSICLTEFGDGSMEVLSMPCNHVYHQDCLVRWLETSHTCPLCRYIMPNSTD